jgi:hypothetical protein
MSARILLYFVKYPEPGKVKTRLAKEVGDEEAAGIYGELARSNLETLRELSKQGIVITVVFDPPEDCEKIKRWLSPFWHYSPQKGLHLGERLENAFQAAFGQGAQKVIALGSDTLGLDAELLQKAFKVLDHCDIVVGPAKDGGYYLIGSVQPQPFLFNDIPWSTSHVLEATLERIQKSGLSYGLLRERDDLDCAENLPYLLA